MRNQSGITLIETVIGLAIFAVAMVGLYSLMTMASRISTDSRARLDATALANQRMEMVRNLPYDTIGTIGGIPNGTLAQTENVVLNRITYTVRIEVVYVDDPFDGVLGGAVDDMLNADYKRVRVSVDWPNMLNNTPVTLVTDASPKGIENTESGGTLLLTVFDANGDPVPSADLHITNTEVVPAIDISTTMAANGKYALPGAPAALESYNITISKAGYNTASTYPIDASNPNPTPPPASVYAGSVTELSFSIDLLSELTIRTVDPAGVPIGSVDFRLEGAKSIGSDGDGNSIHKYSVDHSTDASGQLAITGLEWDTYSFVIDPIATGYDIAGSNPILPAVVSPGTSYTLDVVLVPQTDNSLLVTVRDESGVLVPDASVQLTRVAPPYDVTQTTNANGQTFFSDLDADAYSLTIQATGYLPLVEPISINGPTYVEITITP